jgi:hypothetical protein
MSDPGCGRIVLLSFLACAVVLGAAEGLARIGATIVQDIARAQEGGEERWLQLSPTLGPAPSRKLMSAKLGLPVPNEREASVAARSAS